MYTVVWGLGMGSSYCYVGNKQGSLSVCLGADSWKLLKFAVVWLVTLFHILEISGVNSQLEACCIDIFLMGFL